jgi:hypothetical protein
MPIVAQTAILISRFHRNESGLRAVTVTAKSKARSQEWLRY